MLKLVEEIESPFLTTPVNRSGTVWHAPKFSAWYTVDFSALGLLTWKSSLSNRLIASGNHFGADDDGGAAASSEVPRFLHDPHSVFIILEGTMISDCCNGTVWESLV